MFLHQILVLSLAASMDGKGVRSHSQAQAHAILKTHVRSVALLKHVMKWLPINS